MSKIKKKQRKKYANYGSEQIAKQIKDDEEKSFVMVHSFGQLKPSLQDEDDTAMYHSFGTLKDMGGLEGFTGE